MLELRNVSKTFESADGNVEALKNVSLSVQKGEIFGVIGLSGAGKSTLLRVLSGLTVADCGSIKVDGTEISQLKGKELRLFRQNIGVVFQGYNLLAQSTVEENIAFPLKLRNFDKAEIKSRVSQLIQTVGLNGKEKSYPSALSGGQKQRVAIARAISTLPKVLLLDEITAALDPVTTQQILDLLKTINRETQVTMVLITHQMSAVKAVCNRVAVLNYGVIEEEGATEEVLNNPQSEIAKMLLGRN